MAKAKYLLLSLVVVLGFFLSYNLFYLGKIFPNTFVAGVNIGGFDPQKASEVLSAKITPPQNIKLAGPQNTFNLDTKNISLTYDFEGTAQRAYKLSRTGNIILDFWLRTKLIFTPIKIGPNTNLDNTSLDKFISIVGGQISVDPVYPSVKVSGKDVEVDRGKKGTTLKNDLVKALIEENLANAKGGDIPLPTIEVDPTLDENAANLFADRARKYLGKTITLKFEYDNHTFKDTKILGMLDPNGGFKEDVINKEVATISQEVNRDPQEPKLTFDGGRVSEFQPASDGVKVDTEKTITQIEDLLTQLESSESKSLDGEINVTRTKPQTTTDKINDLGIKELIGRGTSTYYHSIASRIHNVTLAASRLNGTLVKPGDTFSFNDTLGDVSEFTGYQQAYIISNGKTVLGDGGGVCQVSTTLFRALLDAGLPITERQAHAYRVGYYEQNSPPGLDATVYSPSPDLKFKNDTGKYILITAKANPKTYSLVFELYGTSDGRISKISKPVVSDIAPPPEDLYQDDPTLPVGTVKQIDFKAWGAKVTFKYNVTRNGETLINRTFISNYRPWQAVFLRGTGPAL